MNNPIEYNKADRNKKNLSLKIMPAIIKFTITSGIGGRKYNN